MSHECVSAINWCYTERSFEDDKDTGTSKGKEKATDNKQDEEIPESRLDTGIQVCG